MVFRDRSDLTVPISCTPSPRRVRWPAHPSVRPQTVPGRQDKSGNSALLAPSVGKRRHSEPRRDRTRKRRARRPPRTGELRGGGRAHPSRRRPRIREMCDAVEAAEQRVRARGEDWRMQVSLMHREPSPPPPGAARSAGTFVNWTSHWSARLLRRGGPPPPRRQSVASDIPVQRDRRQRGAPVVIERCREFVRVAPCESVLRDAGRPHPVDPVFPLDSERCPAGPRPSRPLLSLGSDCSRVTRSQAGRNSSSTSMRARSRRQASKPLGAGSRPRFGLFRPHRRHRMLCGRLRGANRVRRAMGLSRQEGQRTWIPTACTATVKVQAEPISHRSISNTSPLLI